MNTDDLMDLQRDCRNISEQLEQLMLCLDTRKNKLQLKIYDHLCIACDETESAIKIIGDAIEVGES